MNRKDYEQFLCDTQVDSNTKTFALNAYDLGVKHAAEELLSKIASGMDVDIQIVSEAIAEQIKKSLPQLPADKETQLDSSVKVITAKAIETYLKMKG